MVNTSSVQKQSRCEVGAGRIWPKMGYIGRYLNEAVLLMSFLFFIILHTKILKAEKVDYIYNIHLYICDYIREIILT